MKKAFVLLTFTFICDAMNTPSEPLTPRTFRAAFFGIKNNFEKIKDACKNQTDESEKIIDTAVTQLLTTPHQELLHILWQKHYLFSISQEFNEHEKVLAQDFALLHSEKFKYLFKADPACLARAQANVTKTKNFNDNLRQRVGQIQSNKPTEPTAISIRFAALQKKFQSLSNKVFEGSTEAIVVIESIEQDLTTMCAVFLPLLLEPRILKMAEKSLADCTLYSPEYGARRLLKQRLDEFQEKVNQITDQP